VSPYPARLLAGRRVRWGTTAWAACLAATAVAAGEVVYPAISPDQRIDLPADHGSHPAFRTEWWYATGWLETAGGESLGFQVTFFRTRPDVPQDNPSAFAPRQLIIAHAALSDPALGRLRHDQRIARASHGLAGASVGDTRVWIQDWRLERRGDRYLATIPAKDFALELDMRVTQPPMANGRGGYSQKGRDPGSASLYYSLPQLAVTGSLARDGHTEAVRGTAWLDHEWSTALLDESAAGWDWVGINLDDGGALMAFRMRDLAGGVLWSAGTHRGPGGEARHFGPDEVSFSPTRRWRSLRTGTEYPVGFRVRVGSLAFDIEPLIDDQESDSRQTTGAVYWEGAVRAFRDGAPAGRGYLELTGYGERLRLPGE
jgi:predicted secreted hydrolase